MSGRTMKFVMTPVMRDYLRALYAEAKEKHMDVDTETLELIPPQGYVKHWPNGDRPPTDNWEQDNE